MATTGTTNRQNRTHSYNNNEDYSAHEGGLLPITGHKEQSRYSKEEKKCPRFRMFIRNYLREALIVVLRRVRKIQLTTEWVGGTLHCGSTRPRQGYCAPTPLVRILALLGFSLRKSCSAICQSNFQPKKEAVHVLRSSSKSLRRLRHSANAHQRPIHVL